MAVKKTLLEKMQSNENIPKSWVAELRKILGELAQAEDKVKEYGMLIDTLARERDD